MKCVLRWVELDSTNPATSPARWWHENAAIFGLTPDGDSAADPTAASIR